MMKKETSNRDPKIEIGRKRRAESPLDGLEPKRSKTDISYLHQAVLEGDVKKVQKIVADLECNESLCVKEADSRDESYNRDGGPSRDARPIARCKNARQNNVITINSRGDMGWTALRFACTRGDVKMVKCLLNNGALARDDLDNQHRQWTPLHTAAGLDQVECLEVLIDAGARCNSRNVDGLSALQVAVVYGSSTKSIQLLVKKGMADMEWKDDAGQTALESASVNRRRDAVVALLELGCDPFSILKEPMAYSDPISEILSSHQGQERSVNKIWINIVENARKLLLISHEIPIDLLYIILDFYNQDTMIPLGTLKLLSSVFLDKSSIGKIALSTSVPYRLCHMEKACKSYKESI